MPRNVVASVGYLWGAALTYVYVFCPAGATSRGTQRYARLRTVERFAAPQENGGAGGRWMPMS